MKFENILYEMVFLRLSRITLCHKAKLSRFRFYQAERGMIELNSDELNRIQALLGEYKRCQTIPQDGHADENKEHALG